MAIRIRLVLAAVGLLVVGFGVVDTQAGRHRHKLVVKQFTTKVSLPARNDPATKGVRGASVKCPRGYRATGGGYSSDTIAFVPDADLFPRAYEATAVNDTNDNGTLTITVACIRGKTSATAAQAGGPRLERLVERYRAERRP